MKSMLSQVEKDALVLSHGAHAIVPEKEFIKKLSLGKPLVIKLGADPTAPHLHLGHAVVLLKMRQFQDLGHRVIFLIGDFTARIGDPTGKSKTRPPLSEEMIFLNTKTYIEQVSRILDPNKLEVRYNSEWLDNLTSREWIKLCAQVTVARIIEREDFAKRLSDCQPIGMHELLYPLLQAYDSVELKADVELGGTDQTFNLLMGRYLQEQMGLEPQVVVTMPLLVGLDGVQKMSKSLKNDIGLTDTPDQVFGKIMSISDETMWSYYQLLLNSTMDDIATLKSSIEKRTLHPMECKKELAFKVLKKLWSEEAAVTGKKAFEDTFEKRSFDSAQEVTCAGMSFSSMVDMIVFFDSSLSRSQARRLMSEGAIVLNGAKVTDQHQSHVLRPDDTIKIGKHKRFKVV